jgi:hypothetical protein
VTLDVDPQEQTIWGLCQFLKNKSRTLAAKKQDLTPSLTVTSFNTQTRVRIRNTFNFIFFKKPAPHRKKT